MEANYLIHHGILGMKWGVRRYQNKDGSLTEAGKQRYSSELHYNIEQQAKTVFNNSYSNKTGDTYMTKLISSKINDEESIKKEAETIRKEANKLSSLHNQYYKEFGENANRIMKTPAFKKELDKKLFEAFGNGVDDKEYFNWVRDDYIQELFNDRKFESQKLKDLESQIEEKYNAYSNMIEKATNNLVKDFGDKKIDNKYSIKYKDVVKEAVATNSGIGWAAYEMKNRSGLALYENSYMPSESSYNSVYTFEEYNRKH